MNPLDQWQQKLEATLKDFGIATGYDAEAEKLRQAEWIAEQERLCPKGRNEE